MPIITSSSKIIFFEGKPVGSYDYALLNHLLSSSGPQIIPIGSKYGFNARIEGYCLACDAEPKYLAFRDRDFDFTPPDKADLIRIIGAKPIFTTYKACLENYLIDPDLFHEFWQIKSRGPTWKFGPPPSSDYFQEVIISTAKQIAEYQAVRWALSEINPQKGKTIRIENKWLENGQLPNNLSFEDCLIRATELVNVFLSETKDISIEKLNNIARDFLQRFSTEEFFDSNLYINWFHGKDLLKSIFNVLKFQPLYGLYIDWGLNNLNFCNFPDLLSLKQKCDEL